MTEAEKRERRALERKLSEMEEELKVKETSSLFFFFGYLFLSLSLSLCRPTTPIPTTDVWTLMTS